MVEGELIYNERLCKAYKLWTQTIWIQVPPPSSCMTKDGLLNFSLPQFFVYKMGITVVSTA